MENQEKFERRWFMFDLARQRVFHRCEFILWLDALQRLGYNGAGLYLEGAFAFESIPGVIRENVMTPEDAKWAVEQGRKRGIYVFPMTNVVGHMEHFFGQERYRGRMSDLSERQMDFQMDGAEDFVMNIIHEYVRHFGADMVHVGGDETTLTPETKVAYAKFLARICANLLQEGIQPAIWADMIWMDPPLCEYIDRRTFIFDWSYYGHRPESPRFFKNAGFKDVIICGCDNSWEGIINYQRASGYLKASPDPVKPDEIEAFFDDAKKSGVMNGLLTSWNNETGRNMWAQWVPFARAALFMNGKFEAGTRDDEKIEKALFGRITPYTKVTYLLQDEIQRPDIPFEWFIEMRSSLFTPERLLKLLNMSWKEQPTFPEDFDKTLHAVDEELLSWTPQNAFEEKCHAAMVGVAAMVRAANEIIRAGRSYRLYARAAALQFNANDSAAQLISQTAGTFRRAAAEVGIYASVFVRAICDTGHTKFDLERLKNTEVFLERIAEKMEGYGESIDRIPLPRFERILDCVIRDLYIM